MTKKTEYLAAVHFHREPVDRDDVSETTTKLVSGDDRFGDRQGSTKEMATLTENYMPRSDLITRSAKRSTSSTVV